MRAARVNHDSKPSNLQAEEMVKTVQEEAAKPQPCLTVQAVLGFPFLQHVSTEPFS